MKVSGFSFVRNAIKFDYPIIEAINSILPLCDEFIIAVGSSDDETLRLIKSINSDKIKIIETIWDDSLRVGGRVLAVETDKAIAAIDKNSDWAFYIQGDEIVHEKYHQNIIKAMNDFKDSADVDGLLFKYKHFFGSYDYVADAPDWYRREIRIIRPDRNIYSYKDAQGFRKGDNKVLNVKLIDAYVYHYGWVKRPETMQQKQENFHKLWHDDQWVEKNVQKKEEFDYSIVNSLCLFDETHPVVMQARIDKQNWKFDYDISYKKLAAKDRLKQIVEKYTGYRIGEYRNYRII